MLQDTVALRVVEESMLLILANDNGAIVASMPHRSLNTLLAGAVLTDLTLEGRIATVLNG